MFVVGSARARHATSPKGCGHAPFGLECQLVLLHVWMVKERRTNSERMFACQKCVCACHHTNLPWNLRVEELFRD